MKSIRYPFKTSMREFCKYLDKRGIETIEPISILVEENEKEEKGEGRTTIFYNEISQDENLKNLYGAETPPFLNRASYISYPDKATELEQNLWIFKDKMLIEEGVGVYWKFNFDLDTRAIKNITCHNEIYHRTQNKLFPYSIVLVCPKNNWEANFIVLEDGISESKSTRYTHLVSGTIYHNLDMKSDITEENSSKIKLLIK